MSFSFAKSDRLLGMHFPCAGEKNNIRLLVIRYYCTTIPVKSRLFEYSLTLRTLSAGIFYSQSMEFYSILLVACSFYHPSYALNRPIHSDITGRGRMGQCAN